MPLREKRYRALRSFALVLALAAGGCGESGDGLPREPVSGKITLDGQPIENGLVTFVPTASPEPIATALIENGEYSLGRAEGPIPGLHKVTVWARKATGRKVADSDNPEVLVDEIKEIVPARYNLQSELTAEVRADGDNAFEFDLKSGGNARPGS